MANTFKSRAGLIAKILVFSCGLLLLLMSLGMAWLLLSTTAPQWVIAQIKEYGGVQLTVEQTEGSLSGPLVLRGLNIEVADTAVTITKLDFDWLPSALFQRELYVNNLNLTGVIITLGDEEKTDTEIPERASGLVLSDVRLPINVYINKVSCQECVVNKKTEKLIEIKTAQASLQFNETGLHVANLDVDSDIGVVALQGKVNPVDHYPLELVLSWQHTAKDNQVMAGKLNVEGDVRRLNFVHSLSSPVTLNLNGMVKDLQEKEPQWRVNIASEEFNMADVKDDLPPIRTKINGDISGRGISYSGKAGFFVKDRKTLFLQGDVEFSGNDKHISIEKLKIKEENTNALLAVTGAFDFASKKINSKWHWQGVRYPLQDDAIIQSRSGEMVLDGDLEAYTVSLDASIYQKNINDVEVKLSGKGDLKGLEIDQLFVDLLDGKISGSSKLSWENQFEAISVLAWQGIRWKQEEQGDIASDGALDLRYAGTHYEFGVTTFLDGSLIPAGQWRMTGQGQATGLDEVNLYGETLEGSIEATAKLSWDDFLAWRVNIDFSNINPGAYKPDWPGELAGKVYSSGKIVDEQRELTLEVHQLTGLLRGLPLRGNAYAAINNDMVDVSFIDLTAGDTSLQVAGRWAEQVNMTWDIVVPNLQTWLEDADGSLWTRGSARGLKSAPLLEVDFKADQLRWQETLIDKAHVNGTLDLVEGRHLDSEIVLKQATISGQKLEEIIVKVSGSLALHQITTDVLADGATLHLMAQGQWQDETWRGNLKNLDMASGSWGEWRLKENTALSVNENRSILNKLCLISQGDASVCAQADYRLDQWTLEMTGHRLPLTNLNSLMDREVEVEGLANAELIVKGRSEDYKAKLTASTPTTVFKFKQFIDESFQLSDTQLIARLDDRGANVKFESNLGQKDTVKFSAALPGLDPKNLNLDTQVLKAMAELEIQDIQWIKALVPEVEESKGQLKVNLAAHGLLGKPKIRGELRLKDGALVIPRVGLNIKAIDVQADTKGDNRLVYNISANSGEGDIKVNGLTLIDVEKAWPTQLSIVGNDFELLKIPEAHVIVSPKLEVKTKDKNVYVTGDVLIPRAKLQPKDVSSAVSASEDMEIIGDEKSTASGSSWKIYSTVKLILGERVKFYGYGFEGNIAGNLQLIDEPGQLTKGRGELVIPDGRYRAYGQRLDIENGKILFAGGPVSNPGLDIRAVRVVDNVVAGIKVRGTVLTPKIELFSQPAMSQANALSYLILGRPMEGASTQEDGALLLNAALALGLGGGDTLARQIGDRFGFDEMRVDTGESGDASLIIGRYLTPRLYISYGIGLIDSMDSVNVRYQLAKRWRAVAEKHGKGQGADIIYTIER